LPRSSTKPTARLALLLLNQLFSCSGESGNFCVIIG